MIPYGWCKSHSRIASAEAVGVEDELYRACVPGPDPKRWLCLFVNTTQRPAGVTVDADRSPDRRDISREERAGRPVGPANVKGGWVGGRPEGGVVT